MSGFGTRPYNALPVESDFRSAVGAFIDTFGGNRERVFADLKEYWVTKNGFGMPVEAYDYLMSKRVASGEINEVRAGVLRNEFAASFHPEYTTGYLPKDRGPLVDGLMDIYTRLKPVRAPQPLLIKSDISNLGGLNQALGSFSLANDVIGSIAGILRNKVSEFGDLVAVRSGGDEWEILLSPKEGVIPEQVRQALTDVQSAVLRFTKDAGLEHIIHLKYPDNQYREGVNIGVGVVPVTGTKETRSALSEVQIAESKLRVEQAARAADPNRPPPRELGVDEIAATAKKTREALAREEWKSHLPKREPRPASHKLPHFARRDALDQPTPATHDATALEIRTERALPSDLSEAERRAVRGTSAMTQHIDHVTGLIGFPYLDRLLPHFMTHHGNQSGGAKLLHFDFSNMAGGNKIGEWVGDAMGKLYADSITTAMKRSGLEALSPYLASQGGGKFTLLVPATLDATILLQQVGQELTAASERPLPIPEEMQARTQNKLRNDRDLAAIYSAEERAAMATQLLAKDIKNPKTHLPGVQFTIVLSSEVVPVDLRGNPTMPIGEMLKPMEAHAQEVQAAITEDRRSHGTGQHTQRSGHSGEPESRGTQAANPGGHQGAGGNDHPTGKAPGIVSPHRFGGAANIVLSTLGMWNAYHNEEPTALDQLKGKIDVGSGLVGLGEGFTTWRGYSGAAMLGRLGVGGAMVSGGVGVVQGALDRDLKKIFVSAETVALGFAGAEAGSAIGAFAGPYGAIAGGIVGAFAGVLGFNAIMDVGIRPREMSKQEQAFFRLVDDLDKLPAKPDPALGEALSKLVVAKAAIVAANAQLDGAIKAMPPQNLGAARKALEGAENGFFGVFEGLRNDGTLKEAMSELTLRLYPEMIQQSLSPEVVAALERCSMEDTAKETVVSSANLRAAHSCLAQETWHR